MKIFVEIVIPIIFFVGMFYVGIDRFFKIITDVKFVRVIVKSGICFILLSLLNLLLIFIYPYPHLVRTSFYLFGIGLVLTFAYADERLKKR